MDNVKLIIETWPFLSPSPHTFSISISTSSFYISCSARKNVTFLGLLSMTGDTHLLIKLHL